MSVDYEADWKRRVDAAIQRLNEHLIACARDKIRTHLLLALLVALMVDGNYGITAAVGRLIKAIF